MTLALLITAATGARAAWTGGTYTATANETLGAITVNGDATLTINSDVTVTVFGGINIASGTLTVTGPGTLVVTGAKGNNGASGWNGGNGGNGGVAISGNIIVQGGATVTANGGSAGSGGNGELEGGKGGNGGNAFSGTLTYKSGTVTARGGSAGSGGWGEEECASSGSAGKAFANDVDFTQTTGYSVTNGTSTIGSVLNQPVVVISGGAPAGPEVTINDDKTEASFKMPQYDLTATYTLKRDLSVETQVTVGDGTDGVRYRVQKQGNVFHPVGLTADQVKALFKVHDNIEDADLTATEDYTVEIYAVDDDGKTVGEPQTFATFTYAPGQYIVKAQGQGNYVGQTTESNIFTLYQGYEIVVAANEYATYYKDEALYIEDEDAQLYTITAVGKETATATEVTTAAANMPILVKNNSAETKTILLIPTTDQTPDNVTAADEFLGTLTVKEFTADETSAASYYVCNGKEFVQVRGAGSLGANKAYLKVNGSAAVNAPRLVIGFGGGEGTTGVDLIDNGKLIIDNDGWYDLNGRKLQGKPTQKGVYIQNGKKVVVK